MFITDIHKTQIQFADDRLLFPDELENVLPFTGGLNVPCLQEISQGVFRPVNAFHLNPHINKSDVSLPCLILKEPDTKIIQMKLEALHKSDIGFTHFIRLYDYFFQKKLPEFQKLMIQVFGTKQSNVQYLAFYCNSKSQIHKLIGDAAGLSELKLLKHAHDRGILNVLSELSALIIFNSGKLRNIVSILEGLKRKGTDLNGIYPEIVKLCPEENNPDHANYPAIKTFLEMKLNPTVSEYGKAFQSVTQSMLEGSRHIKLDADFETGTVIMNASLKTSAEFRDLSDRINHWDKTGKTEKLLEVLNGDI